MIRTLTGDCRDILRTLPDASVQCVVTSPPYYGLRDYGVAGQIGLEASPDEYVATLGEVFREVRRVLRDDGTLWLNLGDSYFASQSGLRGDPTKSTLTGGGGKYRDGSKHEAMFQQSACVVRDNGAAKPKDLLMMPARVALALQADGWWLRSAIVWHKPNPMPESVTDRPTSAYEMVYLLTKSPKYFFDADAVAEVSSGANPHGPNATAIPGRHDQGRDLQRTWGGVTRNIRNVWTIPTAPYPEAHFATFPPELAERCIKAGTRPSDTVLDPFGGAGTVGLVADRLGRNATLIELNPAYVAMARDRIRNDAGMFAMVAD